MMDLLKYIDARLGEAATWASIATLLALAHVNIDPGLWHTVTMDGVIASSLLGILLAEGGKKPPAAIALDVLQDAVALLRPSPSGSAASGHLPGNLPPAP